MDKRKKTAEIPEIFPERGEKVSFLRAGGDLTNGKVFGIIPYVIRESYTVERIGIWHRRQRRRKRNITIRASPA